MVLPALIEYCGTTATLLFLLPSFRALSQGVSGSMQGDLSELRRLLDSGHTVGAATITFSILGIP